MSSLTNIRNQAIQEVERHTFSYYDAQDFDGFFVWRKRVVRDDVLFGPQQVGDVFLSDVWEFCLEFVAEAERDDGKAGVVTTFMSYWLAINIFLHNYQSILSSSQSFVVMPKNGRGKEGG